MPETLPSLFDLSGRAAVLTGGAGLLGRQYIRTLLSAGAHVLVADLDGDAAKREAAAAVAETGGEALGQMVDVSRQKDVCAMLDATLSRWGRLDILINNAAIDPKADTRANCLALQHIRGFPTCPLAAVARRQLDGRLPVRPGGRSVMRRAGRGVIVNVSSTYGLVAPDQRLYQRDSEEEQGYSSPQVTPSRRRQSRT